MKKFIAVLMTAFLSLLIGQASAATKFFPDQSIESLNSSLVYDKDKKKKKKEDDLPEETEPECD